MTDASDSALKAAATAGSDEVVTALTRHATAMFMGSHPDAKGLAPYTDASRYPKKLAELAEAFSLMSVKLEMREFDLCRKVRELEEAVRLRQQFGYLLIALAVLVSGDVLLSALASTSFLAFLHPAAAHALPSMFVWGGMAGFTLLLAWRFRISLGDVGLTPRGWRRTVGESLLVSLVLLIIIVAVKAWAVTHSERFRDQSLIAWSAVSWALIAYAVMAVLQELIFRGVLQGAISRMLGGKWADVWAVVVTSLAFGLSHIHSSLGLVLVSTAGGAIWGALYARQRSLLGAALSHVIVGAGLVVLGLWDFLVGG